VRVLPVTPQSSTNPLFYLEKPLFFPFSRRNRRTFPPSDVALFICPSPPFHGKRLYLLPVLDTFLPSILSFSMPSSPFLRSFCLFSGFFKKLRACLAFGMKIAFQISLSLDSPEGILFLPLVRGSPARSSRTVHRIRRSCGFCYAPPFRYTGSLVLSYPLSFLICALVISFRKLKPFPEPFHFS